MMFSAHTSKLSLFALPVQLLCSLAGVSIASSASFDWDWNGYLPLQLFSCWENPVHRGQERASEDHEVQVFQKVSFRKTRTCCCREPARLKHCSLAAWKHSVFPLTEQRLF
ncbi:hypothetical protein AGIG_G18053 [Arapaima gigas]